LNPQRFNVKVTESAGSLINRLRTTALHFCRRPGFRYRHFWQQNQGNPRVGLSPELRDEVATPLPERVTELSAAVSE